MNQQRKLLSRSERVKCVDLHPTEPWLLTSLYSGIVQIYNYETQVRRGTRINTFLLHLVNLSLLQHIGLGQNYRSFRDTRYIKVAEFTFGKETNDLHSSCCKVCGSQELDYYWC